MNIAQHLLDVLARDTEQIALLEIGGRQYTRRQLHDKILSRARAFISAGLEPGDRTVIQAFPGVELVVSALAVLVAGGVLVLADPRVSQQLFDQRMQNIRPAWYVVDRRLVWIRRLPGLNSILRLFGAALPATVDARLARRLVTPCPGERAAIRAFDAVPRSSEDDAVIVYTGGTLHAPKAVRHSHRSTRAYLDSVQELVDPYPLRSYVADNLQQIFYGLYLGLKVWVPLRAGMKRIRSIAHCMSAGNTDMYFAAPAMWRQLLLLAEREGKAASVNLRLAILGGSPVSNRMIERLQQWLPDSTDIMVLYGLTEAGPVCCCSAKARLDNRLHGNLVGKPLKGIELAIEDPDQDGIGELIIRGASVFSGYLNQPASGGVLKTGDLAKLAIIDGEQNVILMGRAKDMIIRRGINIYPFEIEPMLREMRDSSGAPLWLDCALVGVWDAARDDEVMVLFFVPRTTGPMAERQLSACLRDQLGPDLLPDSLLEIERLPTAGRDLEVDKIELRELAAKRLGLEVTAGAGSQTGAIDERETPA